MKKIAFLSLLVCILLFALPVVAQQKTGNVTGRVMLHNEYSQHRGMEAAIGATVSVMTATDTLSTSVGANGVFAIKKVPTGKAVALFQMLGYENKIDTIEVKVGETQLWEMLEPKAEEIESVVVKGKPNPLSVRGDTLIYHAAAVSTLKGDEAIAVLEQMPGVEVGDNSVTVLDKTVSKVYIDGRLMFGDDPMTALKNLSASEVINIKTYDEYSNKDPRHKQRDTDEKQRVLDIETKSKLKIAYTGNLLAGLGADMGQTAREDKWRYTGGGDLNLFSEPFQMRIEANTNNIGRSSNRRRGMSSDISGGSGYTRTISTELNISKKWMSETANFPKAVLDGQYSFNNSKSRSGGISQQIYFPSEDYTSREYSDTTDNMSLSKSHNMSIGFLKTFTDGVIGLNHSMSFTDRSSTSHRASFDIVDGNSSVGTNKESRSASDGISINESLSFYKGFNDKWRLGIMGSFAYNNSDGDGWSRDTLTSSATTVVLQNNSTSFSRNASANTNLSYNFTPYSSLSLGYSYAYNYSIADQQSFDMSQDLYPQLVDTTNTYHYTRNTSTNNVNLSFNTYFPSIEGILNAGVSYKSSFINRNESFPDSYDYRKTFNAVLPWLAFNTNKMINNVSFNYNTSTSIPSIEQLREQINNSNLYSLSVGNSKLKQSYTHNLSAGYNTVVGREATSTLNLNLNGSITNKVIATKRTYYTQPTNIKDVLPNLDYDYTIPAQATLTTYENVDNSYSLSGSMGYDTPINFIKCNFTSNLSMSYSDSPSYVQDALNRTSSYRPALRVGLRSNFSRKIQINATSSSTYNYARNTIGDDNKIFTEGVSVNWSVNDIFGFLYVGGNYSGTFYRNVGSSVGQNVNTNILNLSAGMRFGKNNNFDLSANVYDVLNRNPGYSTSMQSNYVQNSWSQQFGRFYICTLSYKFNSTHSGGSDFMGGRGGSRGGHRSRPMGAPMGGAMPMRIAM